MSVNKFGQVLSSKGGVAKGPPGEGFKLTPEGDYDIENKRMVNVGVPIADNDVVTRKYFETNTMTNLPNSYSARNKRIENLAAPKELGDAVNLQTIAEQCVLYQHKTVNVGNRLITKVKDPTGPNHAATKRYVDAAVPVKTGGYWSFEKRRLVSLADPVDNQDAVTKSYLLKNCPKKQNDNWNFENMGIKYVRDPKEMDEAVNLKVLTEVKSHILEILTQQTSTVGTLLTSLTEGLNDVKGLTTELEGHIYENSVKSEKQLRKFGQLLFSHIHGVKGRSTETLTADNFINWEEVFKAPEPKIRLPNEAIDGRPEESTL